VHGGDFKEWCLGRRVAVTESEADEESQCCLEVKQRGLIRSRSQTVQMVLQRERRGHTVYFLPVEASCTYNTGQGENVVASTIGVSKAAPATEHKIEMTSAEVANIWSAFMNDTLAVCMLGSFLSHIEDQEVHAVLDGAMKISQTHVQKLKSLFTEEKLPIPDGFSETKDWSPGAPRLFTDDFHLFYLQNLGKQGLELYAMSLANSARLDICEYFTECLSESAKLFNKATEVMLNKGTFIRAPYIPPAQKVEYVQQQHYLAGWFGHRRPLNAIEMSNIYFNLIQNQLGRTLLMGFSQVAASKQVREFMVRGRDIADKHVEIFGSLLSQEFLPSASIWDTLPTDSSIAPFSDKLLMFHTTALIANGIGRYGKSLGLSARRDLAANYVRLTAEIVQYTEDGANIMIENGWLEQPPQATDRDQLVKHKS